MASRFRYWHRDIEALSALLALCEGGRTVPGRSISAQIWCFLCGKSEQALEQTAHSSVIWDAGTFLWYHCNEFCFFHCCYDGWMPHTRLEIIHWYVFYHDVDEIADLSQSDCSNWVMWAVKDPCQRPRWNGCLTQECFSSKKVNIWKILLFIYLITLKSKWKTE